MLNQWNEDVTVIHATHRTDAHRIAIHLLNPTQEEFDRAQEQAERDGFWQIVIHTPFTWPRKK
jgi:hypothetical protein